MIRISTHRRILWLIGLVLFSVATGCSSTSKTGTSSKPGLKGADETIFFGDTVEKNYDPIIIMKRAESFFEKKDYPEAIVEYQRFLELHHAHVLAPYAQFKHAESHYKMFKTLDRDPTPIRKALESYEKLLRDFPSSQYESQAKERIASCHDHLAHIHLMIGQFYYRRGAYLAAAARFEAILNEYPDQPIAADAFYHLAKAYDDLGAENWAREKLEALAKRYPNHPHTQETKSRLAQLRTNHTVQVVAKAESGSLPQETIGLPSFNRHQSPKEQAGLTVASIVDMALGGLGLASNRHDLIFSPGQPRAVAVSTFHPSLHANAFTSQPDTLMPPITFCRVGVWC